MMFVHARARLAVTTSVLALLSTGCLDATPTPGPAQTGGLALGVAALSLEGVGDVIWDLEVVNGASTPETVWQRRIASSRYGDGAGSASYVGTCDAGAGVAQNTVKVWVVGVYSAPVTSLGTFNRGLATGVGAVGGETLAFQNPTTETAPLEREVACVEGRDANVQFDVALMRPAQQGFFDVAVNFNSIFCSAKFDCCYDTTNDGCAADGSEDIALLFDATGARGRTFVLGLACTAGTAAAVDTRLYLSSIALDCTPPHAGTDFAADVTLNPAAGPGNLCAAGALTNCPAITAGGAVADSHLFQIAVFRGVEELESDGGSAHKVYWNLALGVKEPAIASCRLRAEATADDAVNTDDRVDAGVIAAGAVYPYIQWDVALDASCGSEPLTFGASGASVTTRYTGTTDAATGFAYGYGPTFPADGFCDPVCVRGTCVEGTCRCPTEWTGDDCDTHAPACGDGLVEGAETCDGDCPASCDDADACTVDALSGSAESCNVVCANTPITACADGDGCCPAGCTGSNDDDCLPASCATTTFTSCRAILNAGCSTGDGPYTVDYDGTGSGAATTAYCAMTDGGYTYRTTDTTAIANGYYQLTYNDGGPYYPSGCPATTLTVYPMAAAQAINCNRYDWSATNLSCLRTRYVSALVGLRYYGDGTCVSLGDRCPNVVKTHFLQYRCY